jgi:hypothetical protein
VILGLAAPPSVGEVIVDLGVRREPPVECVIKRATPVVGEYIKKTTIFNN